MKKCIVSSFMLVVAALLCACSGEQKQSGDNSIVIWTNLENEAAVLQEYAQKWSEETGNTATVLHETPELQQFSQAVKSADGPDGVYGIANDQLANFVSANLAEPLPDDLFKDGDYSNASIQAVYSGGKRYGVPIAVETITLFYNTEKIDAPPQTFEDLVANAETYGFRFEGTSIYYDMGFFRAFDSYIFKYDNGSYNAEDLGLGNDGAIKGYEYLKMLSDKGFTGADITSDIARGSFQSGETAFYIGGSWDVAGFLDSGVAFATAKMPTLNGKGFVTPVGTQVGFVSAKSDNKSLVFDFYKYLQANAQEALYNAGGRLPASLAAQGNIEIDAYTKGFLDQIAAGEPLPTVAELGQVWTPFSDNMKLLFSGEIDEAQAADYIFNQVSDGIKLMNSGR